MLLTRTASTSPTSRAPSSAPTDRPARPAASLHFEPVLVHRLDFVRVVAFTLTPTTSSAAAASRGLASTASLATLALALGARGRRRRLSGLGRRARLGEGHGLDARSNLLHGGRGGGRGAAAAKRLGQALRGGVLVLILVLLVGRPVRRERVGNDRLARRLSLATEVKGTYHGVGGGLDDLERGHRLGLGREELVLLQKVERDAAREGRYGRRLVEGAQPDSADNRRAEGVGVRRTAAVRERTLGRSLVGEAVPDALGRFGDGALRLKGVLACLRLGGREELN